MGRRCCTRSTHHGILFPFSLCATLCHLSPNYEAQDCGEPHPPSPPSHGTPQGKIYQATKLRIAENPICPFLPPMDPLGEDPLSHKAQDCRGPHLLFSSSHGTPHGRIHQVTKPRIAEALICSFLPPMEHPMGGSIKPQSPRLQRPSSALFSLPWNSPGEDPPGNQAQDCGEPHPPFPPSHGPP